MGATAKIEEVSTACDRAGRMAVLGFIPGRMVKVTRPNLIRREEDTLTWDDEVWLHWHPASGVVLTS